MSAKSLRSCLIAATIVVTLSLGPAKAVSSEPEDTTPQQVFDGMSKSFRAEKAKGVRAR